MIACGWKFSKTAAITALRVLFPIRDFSGTKGTRPHWRLRRSSIESRAGICTNSHSLGTSHEASRWPHRNKTEARPWSAAAGSEKRRAYFDPRLPRVGEDGHLVLTGPVIGSSYEPNRRASTSAIDPEQSFAACKVPAGYRHHKIPVLGYPNSSWISGKKIGNHRGEPHAITEWYAYHGQHTLQQSNKAGLPK